MRYNADGAPTHAWRHGRIALAYSLNDLYRSLRVVMRFNGLALGLGGGTLLLVFPRSLVHAGLQAALDPLWPLRLAGGLLLALGILFLLAAQERMVSVASMITMTLANGLVAVVMLVGYLQGEFAGLGLIGQLLLIALFLFCLVCALMPLRYLRTDYVVL